LKSIDLLTLDRFVGNDTIKESTTKIFKIKTTLSKSYILWSKPVCGKTTLARLIVKNLDCDYIYMLNASDERGIETIRDKVSGFASTASFKPLKVVILDEADFLTIQAQASLRNVIETFSRTTRFILTCNYIERIIDPLQSRCQTLKVIPPTKVDVAKHIAWIMGEENISFEVEDLKTVVNQFYPDLRKCLNTIQLSTQNSRLIIDKTVLVSSNYMVQVLKELKNARPSWKNIRQIIANSGSQDFEELFRYLYDNASVYAEGSEGMVAIYINEYSYQANFRIDKEINLMGLIAKLIELKK
jgi:replication factor C small subunit